jgi:RNA polymerase sigma-70 factor, ECF subfamily
MDTDDEMSWVRNSQNGDHAAFEALIRTYQQMIHSLSFRMTGSNADAQDVVQETFVRAYQQLGTYQGTAKFSSWIYRIAVNACLDWRKREQSRDRLRTRFMEMSETLRTESESSECMDELSEAVQSALMKLPPRQRAAIVLTVYGNHNHAEAAKILGCSETTVSWRIFTARRKLKKLLESQFGGRHD